VAVSPAAGAPLSPPPALMEGFQQEVRGHYLAHARDLPWRRTQDPYCILVSEVMLQQTQAARVVPKYDAFVRTFPTVASLAGAPFARVLAAWSGLGYNRRALALHQAANEIVTRHAGLVPTEAALLSRLPGIGPNTAAAVCVFAFDRPLVFIETNIRSAFIHFFFQGCSAIPDSQILPLVSLALDHADPRSWYYALMDYGAWVKRTYGNPNRRSAHHSRQAPFAGSRRELRAAVLRALLAVAPTALTAEEVHAAVRLPGRSVDQVGAVLAELAGEGFLAEAAQGDAYRLV
jgi:A/G-specific adenine glycosylase